MRPCRPERLVSNAKRLALLLKELTVSNAHSLLRLDIMSSINQLRMAGMEEVTRLAGDLAALVPPPRQRRSPQLRQ